MDFFRLKKKYTDSLESIKSKVESKLSFADFSMFVRNDYELPNTFLYCAAEFNNVARVSDDDYGLYLMVAYQSYDPGTGIVGRAGDIFAMAGLYRSSGEMISEFEPAKVNETETDFDRKFRSLTVRIETFLEKQEDLIVTTLNKEYLTA